MSTVYVALYLTKLIPKNAPNSPDIKLDEKTLINWDDNETISSGYSGAVYFYSVYANEISSLYI